MSTTTDHIEETQEVPESLRSALRDLHMVPLWESNAVPPMGAEGPLPHLWPWAQTRKVLLEVGAVKSPDVVERRVLTMVDPQATDPNRAGTTGLLSSTLQLLLPGETARPHRHSMSALRYVLEGTGAVTLVEGKSLAMEFGDLILTPGWTWHEHINDGGEPTIWLDALDVDLHGAIGTARFQPGPKSEPVGHYAEDMFAVPNILPDVEWSKHHYSPVFRYPYEDAVAALARTPEGDGGARTIRYVNPVTGDSTMMGLDSSMIQIGAGVSTRPFKSTASAIATVVEGSGTATVAGREIAFSGHDTFTLPQGKPYSFKADGETRLYIVSNRDLYKRLDLLEESYVD